MSFFEHDDSTERDDTPLDGSGLEEEISSARPDSGGDVGRAMTTT